MHVVGAVLVSQRSVPLWTRQRQVVQLQLVALVAVDLVQHLLQHLDEDGEVLQVQGRVHGLREERRHHLGCHQVHREAVLLIT